eukprot:TRINITY_DN68098_c7_g1_i2.p2 TRINITY_DN68098_c7_g1~~TRINITY_DN68098_c7_g1_i2.p2  ORF type:complete len:104 (+),score=14.07 TRINITY_DN68098_c7_g1_i2:615-926(+)
MLLLSVFALLHLVVHPFKNPLDDIVDGFGQLTIIGTLATFYLSDTMSMMTLASGWIVVTAYAFFFAIYKFIPKCRAVLQKQRKGKSKIKRIATKTTTMFAQPQ